MTTEQVLAWLQSLPAVDLGIFRRELDALCATVNAQPSHSRHFKYPLTIRSSRRKSPNPFQALLKNKRAAR